MEMVKRMMRMRMKSLLLHLKDHLHLSLNVCESVNPLLTVLMWRRCSQILCWVSEHQKKGTKTMMGHLWSYHWLSWFVQADVEKMMLGDWKKKRMKMKMMEMKNKMEEW